MKTRKMKVEWILWKIAFHVVIFIISFLRVIVSESQLPAENMVIV